MDCFELRSSESPYELLLKALSLIPISHYLFGFSCLIFLFLYNLLELHFLQDLLSGFRGQPVSLTFNSGSQLYLQVVSKCKLLHGRFSSTPWLCSPHLQTLFLQFFGKAPPCNYRRQILHLSDGGTIALDWLGNLDVKSQSREGRDGVQSNDKSPIMVVVPGLTSDSDASYIKQIAVKMAHHGWNVVVMNYRGLGGVSITSDCIFNSQWTEDLGRVADHLRAQYPQAPLFAVGTSVGSNVLVKHLGLAGARTALDGAVAVSCPWDILLCDRFLHRSPVQGLYNTALAAGLKDYALQHQTVLSRLTDWESIAKLRSVRDFDNHASRVLAKLETVDAYYRESCTASLVGNVTIPLLCISTLDDPVCTGEAIPWDECRLNKNVVLATTQHGGHLAHFEGMAAKSLWWVRVVDEFLCVLHSSPLIHREKIQSSIADNAVESSINQSPDMTISDSLVTAFSNEPSNEGGSQQNERLVADVKVGNSIKCDKASELQEASATTAQFDPASRPDFDAVIIPIRSFLNQLSWHNKISMCVFACVTIITSWPVLGSALPLFFKKKLFSP